MAIIKPFGCCLLICDDRFNLCKKILGMGERQPNYNFLLIIYFYFIFLFIYFAMYQSTRALQTEGVLKIYLCGSSYTDH